MPDVFRFHDFTLDPATGALSGPLGPVPLRPKALALLELLVRSAGRALGKDEIMDAVWSGVTVSDETLTQTVHELRRALGEAGPALIRTVPKRGYLFPAEALATTPPARRRLALLPFANLSSDPEQQFFAEGLGIDLLAALGMIGGIDLVTDPEAADVQLSGSVRAAAGQIRVTGRLVEAHSGRQLWSGRFDGATNQIFALQDEITRKVAIALQVELTTGDFARLWEGQTASLAAWERYVLAYGHYLRWTEPENARARDLLHEALAIDPDYRAAKVMLGKTWWYDARYYLEGEARTEAIAKAERLAREVLAQAPQSANALMLLGGTAWLSGRWDEALALCRRACEMSPSDAFVLGYFGLIAVFCGELDEGLVALRRAASLSPQTFTWIHHHIGHALIWKGEDAAAQVSLQHYIDAEPKDPWGHVMMALAHGVAGRVQAAQGSIAEAQRLGPEPSLRQVRRSHRYRLGERLDQVLAILTAAGLRE